MDVSKKIIEYLDAIDEAWGRNIGPEELRKIIRQRFSKNPEPVEEKIVVALMRAAKAEKYKSHRGLIIKFIRSPAFEQSVPKGLAKEKKFFAKEDSVYVGGNTVEMDLTPAERRRYKFVEHIFNKQYKKISSINTGIFSALKKVSKAVRKK